MSKNQDIEIKTEQLDSLGFTKISIPVLGKTMLVDYKEEIYIFSYFKNDLGRTAKEIEKKLLKEGLDMKTIRSFITLLVDEYLKRTESEDFKKFSSSSGDGETINLELRNRIEELRISNPNITVDQWLLDLRKRLNKVHQVAETNFPNSWPEIEFTLSILKILNIAGCTLPFAGIILARPGAAKTLSSSVIAQWLYVYYVRHFTAKAFVSNNTNVSKENLCEIDMLPRIKYTCVLAPELTPLFSAKEDELLENLAIITSILDGRGYVTHTGAHGRRGYYGDYMFVLVGAAVDIPHRVHKLLANLGPKLYFLRLPFMNKTEQQLLDCLNENYEKKLKQVQDAVIDYLIWWEVCPGLKYDEQTNISKIVWDSSKDGKNAKEYIVKLGRFLALLRGHVEIWSSQNRQHEYKEYEYSYTQSEDPSRASTQLYNLCRGHALLTGRNYISLDDLSIGVKVVLSTASIERVAVMDILLSNNAHVTLSQVAKSLPMSKSTILKVMTELEALKIAKMEDVTVWGNKTKRLILLSEFNWLLSEEFKNLRNGFEPIDNSSYSFEGDEGV